jgi:hypothetical protein
MFHKSSAMSPANDATVASYFLYGAEAGMLGEEEIKKWAYSVIESREIPPVEIIELATSHGREQLFESLKAVRGEPDVQMAGRWLLGALKTELRKEPSRLQAITRKAIQVARSTNQPDEVYYRLDGIDDELFLALNNTYGTVEQCRADLAEELEQYEEYKESET